MKLLAFPARNESLGQKAVKDLNGEGLQPKFHQLDLTDKSSCEKLKTFLQSNYGGLDILVNNAGMAYKVGFRYLLPNNYDEEIWYWSTFPYNSKFTLTLKMAWNKHRCYKEG